MMGYPMGAPSRMWFADIDEDAPNKRYPWRAVLQLDGMCMSVDSMHFATEDDCEAFIRKNLVGTLGWMDGPRRYPCPDCLAAADDWCVIATGEARLAFHAERMRLQFGGWPS